MIPLHLCKNFTAAVIASHKTIVEKIRERKKEEARDEMKRHIEDVHVRLGELYRVSKKA